MIQHLDNISILFQFKRLSSSSSSSSSLSSSSSSLSVSSLSLSFFAACDPNPCLHGGTCHERPGEPEGFICECPQHFFGLKCENVSKGTVLTYQSSIHNVDSYFFSNYYFSVSQIIEQNSAFSF